MLGYLGEAMRVTLVNKKDIFVCHPKCYQVWKFVFLDFIADPGDHQGNNVPNGGLQCNDDPNGGLQGNDVPNGGLQGNNVPNASG